VFSLNPGSTDNPADDQLFAVLVERLERSVHHVSPDIVKMVQQFRLTNRERETIEFLMEGLTSKQIADRMKISPNTVKAFVRTIMVKTGASTRSGIVGKIVPPSTRT
jgi:DNA-binding CsgD family transcriptional regulator